MAVHRLLLVPHPSLGSISVPVVSDLLLHDDHLVGRRLVLETKVPCAPSCQSHALCCHPGSILVVYYLLFRCQRLIGHRSCRLGNLGMAVGLVMRDLAVGPFVTNLRSLASHHDLLLRIVSEIDI